MFRFYHVNQLQALGLFQFLFFQVKKVNHYEFQVLFEVIEHIPLLNINFFLLLFLQYSHYSLLNIFTKLRSILNPLKIINWKLLHSCSTMQIICIPVFKIWRLFIFIIISHVAVISYRISIIRAMFSSYCIFSYY